MSVHSAMARIAELSSIIAAPAATPARTATDAATTDRFASELTLARDAAAAPATPAAVAAAPGTGAAAGTPYAAEIDAAAQRHGIDPALLRSLVQHESGFDPNASSPAGAQGLCQLMPGTAASLGVTDPLDPAQSIEGGAKYLRQQLDRFGGDVRKALAAYNAGPGAVEKFGGVPPYPETQAYVRNILADAPQASAHALSNVPALGSTLPYSIT